MTQENILLSNSGKYKLADLGLSRLKIRVANEDIMEGDSRYMAQELLQVMDDSGEYPDLTKADIFSLGATIYEIMIGRPQLTRQGLAWKWARVGEHPEGRSAGTRRNRL